MLESTFTDKIDTFSKYRRKRATSLYMTRKEIAFYKRQTARGMFLDSLSIFLIGWKVLLLEIHTIHVCPLRIELFLLVFFLLRLYSFLYHLFNIIMYIMPKKSKRASKITSDFFFFFTQVIF
jgi:hypothetical protein